MTLNSHIAPRLLLVATVNGGVIPGELVRVYHDTARGEFRAVLCYDGGRPSRFTYRFDDLADALATAREMIGTGTVAAEAAEVAS